MKQRFKVLMLCGMIGLGTVAFATSTIAWFAYIPTLDFGTGSGKVNVGGGSETSYYESGSGNSIDDPYIISNRNHLYNLAWLQYMGRYNTPSISQKYFKIKNDIDMNGLTLPPIGTDDYPFLGNFDGNNKTISNLVISNDDPTASNSDFGVTKPSASNLEDTTQPKIVGFFGVVGQSPTIEDLTYTSSIVSISNLTLNNLTVKSLTDETLIGLAAGYVDGTMSGVKISGNATINVDGQSTTAAMSSITEHISDYGLVGFSTKTSRAGSYSQDISAFYDSDDDEGQGSNWGGSIAIDDLFDRLLDIKNTYCVSSAEHVIEKADFYENGVYQSTGARKTSSNTTVYEYNEDVNNGTYNNKLGAFQFGDTRTDIHYLGGGHYKTSADYVHHTGDRPITDGTNYLSIRLNENDTALFTNATSIDTCTFWNINVGSTGKISTRDQIGGSTYYLTMVNNVLELTDSSNSAINWTVSTNNGILSIYNGNWHLMYDGDWIVRDFSKTSETWYDISYTTGNTTYYFMPGGTETTNPYYLRSTTSTDDRIHWSYDSTYHGYYYMRGGASRYLMYNPTYPVIANNSKTSSSPFYRLGGSTTNITGSGTLRATYNNSNYTINSRNNNDNGWSASRSNNGYTFVVTAVTININTTDNVLDYEYDHYGPDSNARNDGHMDFTEQDVTYFPLNVKDDYTPADNNTGYMIGASQYNANSTGYAVGTVRIANFYQLSDSIGNFNRQTYKLSNVRTYNASGKATIDDNNHNYQKYDSSKEKVENMLKKHSAANQVYGLHFMDNVVSADNLVTARYAQINTSSYTNYQLPASSIDFNLKERGFVNFFAGTYGNLSGESTTTIDSFFSLHLIRRNASNAITNIYEIEQILSDGNQDHAYIYKLKVGNGYKYTIPYSYNIYNQKIKYVVDTKTPLGNTYPDEEYTLVDDYPNTYSVAFDTSWIKVHNNFDQHVMYYFEIPINCGEFCLGSVENSHFGAYLVYLDIGAFARDNDAIQAYCVTTHVNALAYPDGVDFATAGATGATGGETICIYIPTDITGSVSFAVASNNIEITDSSELTTYSYKGTKYSESAGNDVFTVSGDSPGALVSPPAGGERLIHIVIDAIDGSTWNIDILDTLDEHGDITNTTYPLIKQNGVDRASNEIPEALTTVLDSKIRSLTKVVTLTRNSGTNQFVSTATYDEATRKIVSISISNEDLVGTTIEVGGIVNGYTISINGTGVTNGSIYPAS